MLKILWVQVTSGFRYLNEAAKGPESEIIAYNTYEHRIKIGSFFFLKVDSRTTIVLAKETGSLWKSPRFSQHI